MKYTLQFGQVIGYIPDLLKGAVLTLFIAFFTFWAGAVIGVIGAALKTYGGIVARRIVGIYVVFFTNTPALIQIYFLVYALPEAGVLLAPLTAVLLGMTINGGAYLTEIIRSGFISVRRPELEAAETLGMSRLQSIRYVVLPHVAKTVYAPMSNLFIWKLLGSSTAALFGVEELTGRAINVSTTTFRTIEIFVIAGGIYVVLTAFASAALAAVGRYAFGVKARIF